MYILHKYHTYLLKSYLLQKFTGIISEDHTFIGGSDANHEGLWKWDDGESFTFTDWAPNEPNGDTGENCLKVSQFQNEFTKTSFLPIFTTQGRNHDNFLLVLWEKQ